MLELSSARKNKVNLVDYNCQQDIENRMLMSDFSSFEHDVLEEILFSPLKFPLKKLVRSLKCCEEDLIPILKKLSEAELLSIQDDTIIVDKEKRKYFEFQITRFDIDFKPDMAFLQGILRKVPIHLLPSWYSIPRTSNNIFESMVEKYLLTPQIFQRYLMELNFGDPIVNQIIDDVFLSPDLKISSSDIIAKYNLTRRDFEEIALLLEFNFVCCLSYEKEDDHWLESVVPFYEWNQYLCFLRKTESPPILPSEKILRTKEKDFGFIEDLTELLLQMKKNPIPYSNEMRQPIEKLCLVKLSQRIGNYIHPSEIADEWLNMSRENRALYIYRHPYNQILSHSFSKKIAAEKNIREAEKSIKRVLHGRWVYFDDFLKGVLVPINEDSVVMLKRTGKHWKYTLPVYSDEEKKLIKATIFEWLFETGMVATGKCNGRDCFCVTSFGRFFFED